MSVHIVRDGVGLLITVRLWHPALWLGLLRTRLFGPSMNAYELDMYGVAKQRAEDKEAMEKFRQAWKSQWKGGTR